MTAGCSRRMFLSAALPVMGLARRQPAARRLTTREVIARIKANVGIPWSDTTVDKLIAGSADTPVRGSPPP